LRYHFNANEVDQVMHQVPSVQAFSHRLIAEGMIQAPKSTQGVSILGIHPEKELKVRTIVENLVEGKYLDTSSRLPVLVGKKLAKKLKLDLKNKVILTFPDTSGSVVSGAFRVKGIFQTNNSQWDQTHVFIRRSDMASLTGLPEDRVHETGVIIEDIEKVDTVQSILQSKLSELDVQTYGEISPDVSLVKDSLGLNQWIMTIIIMIALIFGIINTMLMAVLERTKELGMLMAIGMNRKRVFGMILWETILLGVVGMPVGLLLGYISIYLGGTYGIDLSQFATGMQEFGMDPIVKLSLSPDIYWEVALAVIVTALLASIYPSWKATRLKPVEALRKL
jgi:ABC-type lipoprotein release transport system permease subunit